MVALEVCPANFLLSRNHFDSLFLCPRHYAGPMLTLIWMFWNGNIWKPWNLSGSVYLEADAVSLFFMFVLTYSCTVLNKTLILLYSLVIDFNWFHYQWFQWWPPTRNNFLKGIPLYLFPQNINNGPCACNNETEDCNSMNVFLGLNCSAVWNILFARYALDQDGKDVFCTSVKGSHWYIYWSVSFLDGNWK